MKYYGLKEQRQGGIGDTILRSQAEHLKKICKELVLDLKLTIHISKLTKMEHKEQTDEII